MLHPEEHRIVITGVGGLGPVGEIRTASTETAVTAWGGLIAGRDGITPVEETDLVNYPGWEEAGIKVAAGLNVNLLEHPDAQDLGKKLKFHSRAAVLGYVAYREALRNANVDLSEVDPFRVGHYLGTVFGTNGHSHYVDLERISPSDGTKNLFGQAGLGPAMEVGLRGRGAVIDVECASGAFAIENGIRDLLPQQIGRTLLEPKADMVVVGGADAPLVPIPVKVFVRAFRGAADPTDKPKEASRPFDQETNGLVVGEAAAAFVIETWHKAQARGVKEEDVLAEIVGFDSLTDAHNVVLAGIEGQVRVIENTLRMAGVTPDQTGYGNAHETGTKLGGAREAIAWREALRRLGIPPEKFYVTSTKGATGHTMGAAGAIELYHTMMAVRDNIVPPGLKITKPIPEMVAPIEEVELQDGVEEYIQKPLPAFPSENLSPLEATRVPIDIGISTSFGFGGSAVALAVKKFRA